MNDKKEPFNAVGDPFFFKQVGEEHVEVEEEGNGGRGMACVSVALCGAGRDVRI